MLVIFDCDGVLVDSEQIANETMQTHLAKYGLLLSIRDINNAFRGLSMESVIDKIIHEFGVSIPENFLNQLQKDTFNSFRERLQPIDGVEAVLQRLVQQKVPICVASSGSHDKLSLTLGITGLDRYFDGFIYSAADVHRGKPAPDLFLYAARQMGVTPSEAVVIEDSVAGINAAKSAGMQVFAYCEPSLSPGDIEARLGAGAQCFFSMANLPHYLDEVLV
ncbi:HAD family hydrolase [Aurantivibrio plasticivorans]